MKAAAKKGTETANGGLSRSALRRQREREQRLQTILAAAEALFAREGYHKTGMERIADEAEVSVGTVYFYFKNKEELLFTLLKEMNANLKYNLNKALTMLEEPQDKLLAFCDEAFDLLNKEKAYFSVIIDFWGQISRNKRIRQANIKLLQSYRDEITAILKEGAAKGVFMPVDVQLTSVIIVSLIQGTIIQYVIDNGAFDYRELKEKIKKQILSKVIEEK